MSFNYSPDIALLLTTRQEKMTCMAVWKINKQIGACPGVWRYCARGAGVGKAGFEWSCETVAGMMPAEEVVLIVPDRTVVINV